MNGTTYYLLLNLESHTITSPLISGYYVLLPIVQGLTVSDDLLETVSVSKLLTTFMISGYYEKEQRDPDGPFALAVAITETFAEQRDGFRCRARHHYMSD